MVEKKKKTAYKKRQQSTASKSTARQQGEEWAAKNIKRKKKAASKRRKALRIAGIVVCVCAVLALLTVAAGLMIIRHYYGLTNHVKDDDVSTMDFANAQDILKDDKNIFYSREDITDADGNVIGTTYETVNMDELSEEERASIEASIAAEMSAAAEQQSSAVEAVPIISSGDVYNLLLIGVDLRAGQNWNGNSDTMILVSINSRTKKIYMTSFMRDLYANIPGVGAYKLNRAYALGGGPLLVQTIEENYRIKIDNYAWVDFYALINIIDSIGGINMDVSAEEARVANNYIAEMCRGAGLDPASYYISGGNTIHLNGMQAVAYARIRYVGNADFGRTERQRKVLAQMFAILQTKSISEVNAFLNAALPNVTHNISADRVTNLILNAPTYLGYSLESQRVPFDGAYTYAGEMLLPDFEYTINTLKNNIY